LEAILVWFLVKKLFSLFSRVFGIWKLIPIRVFGFFLDSGFLGIFSLFFRPSQVKFN
jgi:hypothetical protein